MTSLHRVYFDANEGSRSDGYFLHLPESRMDIAAIGNTLRDGLRVIIYTTGGLEIEALLEYAPEDDRWVALPVHGTIKHPKGFRPISN